MRYVYIDLRRSETDCVRMEVPAWEVPVLRAVHGAESVVEVGELVLNDRSCPEASDEYARLGNRYGRDPDSGQPYVSLVYGVEPSKLAKAIGETEEAETAPVVKPAVRSRIANAASAMPIDS